MTFADVSSILMVSEVRKMEEIREQLLTGERALFVSDGMQYGPGGEHHLRMNIACPRALCEEGTRRLIKGLTLLQEVCGK